MLVGLAEGCDGVFRSGSRRACDSALQSRPLVSAIAVAAEVPGPEERSHRLRGLGLVLLVTSAVPLVLGLEQWMGPPDPGRSYEASAATLESVVDTLTLVALLAYILFRQSRSL